MKTLVLDLDGTLLKNDKSISAYTADVLNRFAEKGKIIIATGRLVRSDSSTERPVNGL